MNEAVTLFQTAEPKSLNKLPDYCHRGGLNSLGVFHYETPIECIITH